MKPAANSFSHHGVKHQRRKKPSPSPQFQCEAEIRRIPPPPLFSDPDLDPIPFVLLAVMFEGSINEEINVPGHPT
ncbi:unnamed protein product [Linum tenue]|uniref:Uncharacterized protein n=1 Tax=Linum tenue TaxID=586396 RepID=A0AAV0GXY6_9ROSI|nr:unnamed protein product [Linum tenue]